MQKEEQTIWDASENETMGRVVNVLATLPEKKSRGREMQKEEQTIWDVSDEEIDEWFMRSPSPNLKLLLKSFDPSLGYMSDDESLPTATFTLGRKPGKKHRSADNKIYKTPNDCPEVKTDGAGVKYIQVNHKVRSEYTYKPFGQSPPNLYFYNENNGRVYEIKKNAHGVFKVNFGEKKILPDLSNKGGATLMSL